MKTQNAAFSKKTYHPICLRICPTSVSLQDVEQFNHRLQDLMLHRLHCFLGANAVAGANLCDDVLGAVGHGHCNLAKVNFFQFFPTCQVRVVRFYVSLLRLLLLLLLRLLRRRAVSPQAPTAMSSVRRQPRSSALSVPCRTSTATLCAQCSLPDHNRNSLRSVFLAGPQPRLPALSVRCRTSTATLRSVFPAGPQPRLSALSVPCRTSTAPLCAQTQCSVPDLNHDHLSPVFPAGPQPRPSALSVPCRTSTAR